MFSGGAARRNGRNNLRQGGAGEEGAGDMSPEHLLSYKGKEFLALLTEIGYRYFMVPIPKTYLTILVPDAKLVKELVNKIKSNNWEEEKKAYQIIDMLFIPHNLTNYEIISAAISASPAKKYTLSNRKNFPFVILSADAAAKKLTIEGMDAAVATLTQIRFRPVNEKDHPVMFMALTGAFPKIHETRLPEPKIRYEKYTPPNSAAGQGVVAKGGGTAVSDADKYMKFLYLLLAQNCGCMLPLYTQSVDTWIPQWELLPPHTRDAILATECPDEFKEKYARGNVDLTPALLAYLMYDTSDPDAMGMITQLEEGVLKCKKECNKVKVACNNCFRFHTCASDETCPVRGISATDIVRIFATRGLASEMGRKGITTEYVGDALGQYSVSQLVPAAMSVFIGRGQHLVHARDSLDTAIDTAARILGGGYVQALFGLTDASASSTGAAASTIGGGRSAVLASQYVGGFRKDRHNEERFP